MAIATSKIDAKYRAYLASVEWREISFEKKKSEGFRCENCRQCYRARELEVHHRDYTYLYRERWGMHTLQVLCKSCHKAHHEALDHHIAYCRYWRAQRGDLAGLVQPEDE